MPVKLEIRGDGLIARLPKTKSASGRSGWWNFGKQTYINISGVYIFGIANCREDSRVGPLGVIRVAEEILINERKILRIGDNELFGNNDLGIVVRVVDQKEIDREYLKKLMGQSDVDFFTRETVYRTKYGPNEIRLEKDDTIQPTLF